MSISEYALDRLINNLSEMIALNLSGNNEFQRSKDKEGLFSLNHVDFCLQNEMKLLEVSKSRTLKFNFIRQKVQLNS